MSEHMGTVAVKNLDTKIYKRVKALASLRGWTVAEAFNVALSMWVSQRTTVDLLDEWDELEKQARVNNQAFEKLRPKLKAKHPESYAVVTAGKLVGVYKDREDAYRAASKSGDAQCIVGRLADEEPRVVELGWSLLEEVTR